MKPKHFRLFAPANNEMAPPAAATAPSAAPAATAPAADPPAESPPAGGEPAAEEEPPAEKPADPPAPAPASPEASAPQAAATPPAKVSLLASLSAQISSKRDLLATITSLKAENSGLTGELTARDHELATLRAENADLSAKVSFLESERAEITTALESAKAETVTVAESTVAELAAIGVKAESCPEASAETETEESLTARLATEKDPNKRWDIAAKLNAMQDAKRASF